MAHARSHVAGMDDEFHDLDLPPLDPMTDREQAELLYEYLKLFLPSCDAASCRRVHTEASFQRYGEAHRNSETASGNS